MQVNAGVRRGVKLISDRRRRVRSCGASQPSHELRPSNGLQSACLTGINTIVPLDNQNEGRMRCGRQYERTVNKIHRANRYH